MLDLQQPAHAGLVILSEALKQAQNRRNATEMPLSALGYVCSPGAEQLDSGEWQAVVEVQGRGERFTVVGKVFATERDARAHASSVSLVELYNGGMA